jgi:hypothetical protein
MHHGTSRDEQSRVQISVGLFWPYIKKAKMAPVQNFLEWIQFQFHKKMKPWVQFWIGS